MLIESGPALVIDSGVATTFGGHGLTIVLELPEDNFVVRWDFHTDPTRSAPAIDSQITPTGLLLRCSGFDDASGRGSAQPVLLGEIGDDLIFLHFRVFRHGRSVDRSVQYTFYRVAQAQVGWSPSAR